jgi:hypothetical protein
MKVKMEVIYVILTYFMHFVQRMPTKIRKWNGDETKSVSLLLQFL